jgi:hypothetical protein
MQDGLSSSFFFFVVIIALQTGLTCDDIPLFNLYDTICFILPLIDH